MYTRVGFRRGGACLQDEGPLGLPLDDLVDTDTLCAVPDGVKIGLVSLAVRDADDLEHIASVKGRRTDFGVGRVERQLAKESPFAHERKHLCEDPVHEIHQSALIEKGLDDARDLKRVPKLERRTDALL